MVAAPINILILGASYGMLPGVKLALSGHKVTFVGRDEEVAAMALADLEVCMRDRRSGDDIILRAPVADYAAPGRVALRTPGAVDPVDYDFIILAMPEPQYKAPAVADLMVRIAAAKQPCLSIMNLPPPPFLRRLQRIAPSAWEGVYYSYSIWRDFAPSKMSLASPDPQAVRLDQASPGRLTVTLQSNFKAAPFADPRDQLLLQRLANDMSHLKVTIGEKTVRAPVLLLTNGSLFVPLSKWPMLIAGNCRCLVGNDICSIAEAIFSDLEASRIIYEQVHRLVLAVGAPLDVLVDFPSYLKAAEQLSRPSSIARALAAGATEVERIDLLIRNLMRMHDMDTSEVDAIVDTIQRRIDHNAREADRSEPVLAGAQG